MDSLIGRKLGPYEIRARLGSGGMGAVYEGVHEVLQQVRAIKVMSAHLANHASFVSLFRREAMLAARLRHPNIVQIHDVGDHDGLHYIVMEHLTGRSLREVVRSESPLAGDRAIRLLRQLAEALDFAHSQHVSHRDVKPANVFVDDTDRATLVDFGIARAADGTHLTITSGIGTPEYMAPEAFDDEILGPDADPFLLGVGTDRYALGVVAYELLSGQVPFSGRTPQSIAFAQVNRPPPPIRARRPDLPPAVEPVLSRQLAKDPTERYPTAVAFVEALAAALRNRVSPLASPDEAPTRRPDETANGVGGSSAPLGRTPALPDRTPVPPVQVSVPPARIPAPGGSPPVVQGHRAVPAIPAPVLPEAPVPHRPGQSGRMVLVGGVLLVVALLAGGYALLPAVFSPAEPTHAPATASNVPVVDKWVTPPKPGGPTPTVLGTTQPAAGAQQAQPTPALATGVPTLPPATLAVTATLVPATPAPSPVQQLAAAEELAARGETGRAIEVLLALKASDPTVPGVDDALYRAYLLHGNTLLDAGDFDGSWAAFGKAGELRANAVEPRERQSRVILAKQYRAMEDAWDRDEDAAVAAAEDAFKIDPAYREIRSKLYALLIRKADRLTGRGDRDGAFPLLLRAQEIVPDAPEARERLRPYTPTPVPPTAVPVVQPASAPAQSKPVQPAAAPAQSAPVQSQPAAAPAQAAPAQPAPAPVQPAPAPAQPAPAPAQPAPSGGAPVRR